MNTVAKLNELRRRLHRAGIGAPVSSRFDPPMNLLVAYESLAPGAPYDWPGQRRRGNPRFPYVVLQYTLSGAGRFQTPTHDHPCLPGTLFAAIVPSEHRYFLPPGSSGWTFPWAIPRHPFVVQRLIAMLESFGPVWTLPPDALPITRFIDLLIHVAQNSWADVQAMELAQIEMVLSIERLIQSQRYPLDLKRTWIERVRQFVLQHIERPLSIEMLARSAGTSRSSFSHQFRRITGRTPARFVLDVRLAEVERLLTQTDLPLRTIAQQTGFADATHLGKAFRRRLHQSPGAYRAGLHRQAPRAPSTPRL